MRIFLITALILAAACGATYGFLAWATPISYVSVISDELDDRTLNLIGELEQTALADCGPLLDRFILQTGATVLVTDENGASVDLPVSISVQPALTEGRADVLGGVAVQEDITSVTITDEAYVTGDGEDPSGFPFFFADLDAVFFLHVVYTTKTANQAAEAMGRVLPYVAVVVLVISLLGAVFYSRYITKPIVRLSGISQKMADLDFSWTCGGTRTDEIGQLGRNLDALSQRLSSALTELRSANEALKADIDRERELERQRAAFFSAASHELKTPITILKGQLAGMLAGVDIYQDRDKYLAKSLSVTGRMEELVREILAVSRMERADFVLKWERVDLSALTQRQAAALADLAEQRGQALQVSVAPGLTCTGDAALLERAVSNLLNNASSHSPPGAQVQVRLEQGGAGPVLTVENTQAFIPDEDLPHLFEAFFRVDPSRSRATGGSGLGLYLVKMILDRHGAVCRIANTPDGVAAVVEF